MRAQLLARSLIAVATLACASTHTRPPAGNAPAPSDATRTVYQQYGLIALPSGAVGQFFFLAGATPDSTTTIFVVSVVPSGGLDLELTRGGAVVQSFHIVSTRKFRQTIALAPGVYDLTSGAYQQSVVVPQLGGTSLAQPVPLRTTAIIGRDTTIGLYLETYGASDAPVTLCAPGWCDTLTLHRDGNGSRDTIQVPVSRLAPGVTTFVLARGHDTARSTVFVGFSYPLVISFDRTINALRYLVSRERLDSLRHTPEGKRPQAWADFVAQNKERLPEYLERIREATKRYTEGTVPGWETDRGSAYVQLGDPDQVFVEPDVEIWVYTRYFGRLKFDHRRLAPESRQMLATLVAQVRSAR